MNVSTLGGVNVILTEQLVLGARVAGQVFVSEKLDAFVPAIEMELMASSCPPTLTMENTCVGLVVPATELKFAVEGKIETAGPVMACVGLPEMAKPPVELAELNPELNGEPDISVRFPDC